MSLVKIKDDFFWGGAMIAINVKIFHNENSVLSEIDYVEALKQIKGGFQIGRDTECNYYGPYLFDWFSQDDFSKEEKKTLLDVIKGFEMKIPNLYFGDTVPEANTFTDVLKDKIPVDILTDGNAFVFKGNYGNDKEKAGISSEVIGYDYFFSVIATTNSKLCLVTIWYD